MKRFRIVGLSLALCLTMLLVALLADNTALVFADSAVIADTERAAVDMSVEQVSSELFGDKTIKTAEYLYNLNDSPDFVYVDFEEYGYAVFLRETSELLEYAPTGSLAYPGTRAKKYYGGPTNYFSERNFNF
jgi:hypothetical protein